MNAPTLRERAVTWATIAVERYACPVCHVAIGVPCIVLATGKRAHETHVGRWSPLADAFGEGYMAGEQGCVSTHPVTWYDLIAQHQVVAVGEAVMPDRPAVWCACGALCTTHDGGHPGHIIDVMHEHELEVARLA